MNKVIETIFERRSIRTFEPRAIETERVAEILECGRRAPNAWGHQSFELFAITDPLLMDELAALTAKYLGGKVEEHRFFSAPLIVLISDLRENFMRLADAGCIMENMFIAAQSYGIGSVWINQLSPISDKLEVMDKLESIGIAKNRVVTSIGAFGYPAGAPREKELVTKIHYINQEGSL